MDESSERDKSETENLNISNSTKYESLNMPSDWQFAGVSEGFPEVSEGFPGLSFVQTLWHDPADIQNTRFSTFNVENSGSSSNATGTRNADPASLGSSIYRPLGMILNPPNLLSKGYGLSFPNGPDFLPQNLAQFPADSGFIERAARFSCFGGGNLGDIINHPLGVSEPMGLCSQSGRMMQGPQETRVGSAPKSSLDKRSPENGVNFVEPPKDPFLRAEQGEFQNKGNSESLVRSIQIAKQGIPWSRNVSDEAQSSGGNGQNEQSGEQNKSGETPFKSLGTKKRKRTGQDSEPDQSNGHEPCGEAADNVSNSKQTDEQKPNSDTNQMNAGKQGKRISDPPKEGYIHVRARSGQATNSHSLAERVRREKISDRMKFLQDLVPGCNKVTGKAVMLDEIINYVQSLQRQVEFLSMKLAAVNPRLDYGLKGLLTKEALHSRSSPSSTIPFPQDMLTVYPPLLHPFQPGHIHSVLSGMSNPSNFLQRTVGPQLPPASGGFKQHDTHVWGGDLQNVVQMSCGTSAPTDNQDVTESLPPGNMKAEP